VRSCRILAISTQQNVSTRASLGLEVEERNPLEVLEAYLDFHPNAKRPEIIGNKVREHLRAFVQLNDCDDIWTAKIWSWRPLDYGETINATLSTNWRPLQVLR
jgi:hypothetical protein